MSSHIRLRRNRRTAAIRDLVAENCVHVQDLIYPVFIVEGNNREEEIALLPGQYNLSIDKLLVTAEKCVKLGIRGIALFPKIETNKNDPQASEAYNQSGLVPRAIHMLKREFPELAIFSDIALDAYTMDGHDGITDSNGCVVNDLSCEILAKQAICHATAGADFVCPSDMMDGRVKIIRETLDKSGFYNTGIMSYAAKYASHFYGPFRAATGAMSNLGVDGKKTYQMNPANTNEALHEVELDLIEGADIIMVKPGLPYLDVLYRIKQRFNKPMAAYHVSGEYAMLKFASINGALDYNKAILEAMLCFKRAGADMIWTYAAIEVAELL